MTRESAPDGRSLIGRTVRLDLAQDADADELLPRQNIVFIDKSEKPLVLYRLEYFFQLDILHFQADIALAVASGKRLRRENNDKKYGKFRHQYVFDE